jgi:hypothetical protein
VSKKVRTTKPAVVKKVIPSQYAEPEKAEIHVKGADPLYQEIRIENAVTDESGHKAKLKPGAEVEVTVAADKKDTVDDKK